MSATQKERQAVSPFCNTSYICQICHKTWKANPDDPFNPLKLPTIAVKNGLEFPELPPCLTELTALEAKCGSPNLEFLQIRDNAWDLNSQVGIKGSAVIIPIDNSIVLHVLPRDNNNLQII